MTVEKSRPGLSPQCVHMFPSEQTQILAMMAEERMKGARPWEVYEVEQRTANSRLPTRIAYLCDHEQEADQGQTLPHFLPLALS